MSRSSPSQWDVRRAIAEDLRDIPDGALVAVACSGGADSYALAAAFLIEAKRLGIKSAAITVDHGLQEGSAQRAREVASTLVKRGFEVVEVVHVHVTGRAAGPEGDARRSRYEALDAAAGRLGAAAVLLGHTCDDQAETVLLGLARGSGARSLSGMRRHAGLYRRPLLDLPRAVVRDAVPDDLRPWEDPHNADSTYLRSRARHKVLPVMEQEIGPGVAPALHRTARLLRFDADALDAWADTAHSEALTMRPDGTVRYDVESLTELPTAVRWRVLRRAVIGAGSSPTAVTAGHVEAVDALVMSWHGQIGVDLPGGIRVSRADGELSFARLPQAPRY